MTPTLIDCLSECPHLHIRAIASRLNVRGKGQNRKADWIEGVAQTLLTRASRMRLLQTLSPAARQALLRLTGVESLPALLFLNQYGPLRLPGQTEPASAPESSGVRLVDGITANSRPSTIHADAPPWRAPETVAAELFYSGFLFPTESGSIAKARRLHCPPDLRAHLAAELASLSRTSSQTSGKPAATTAAFHPDAASGPDLPMPDWEDEPIPTAADTAQAYAVSPVELHAPTGHARSACLLHDLCQLLIYLHQQPNMRLLHARWLSPTQLAHLQERLLLAAPPPAARSHKQARWPAFLLFLAAAAGLQSQGRLTALGWEWLSWPPPRQLQALWERWLDAPPPLRQAYDQPGAHIEPPWLSMVCRHLPALFSQGADVAPASSAAPHLPPGARLANRILAAESHFDAFFAAYFYDLAAVDHTLAQMLNETFCLWGVLEGRADSGLELTPSGRWLLARLSASPPTSRPDKDTSDHAALPASWRWLDGETGRAATVSTTSPTPAAPSPPNAPANAIHITLSARANPATVAHLAGFAHYVAHLTDPANVPADAVGASLPADWLPAHGHLYGLTAQSVAMAAAHGLALPTLFKALVDLGIEQEMRPVVHLLHQWYGAGGRIWVGHLPILQTSDAAHMAQIQQHAELKPFLGQLHSPTLAIWQGEQERFLAALTKAGFFPRAASWRAVDAVDDSAPVRVEASPLPAESHPAWLNAAPAADAGALWLAGQSYLLLGQHLPLPVPLYSALLDSLYAGFNQEEQANLQAQLRQIQEMLQAVLDQLPFTPPPQPTDPAHWRPLIEQAITQKQLLQLTYFSAGRNLRTARLVEPYWIEEHNQTPYLRAWCHSAQRVLTFRLDRIESCELRDVAE